MPIAATRQISNFNKDPTGLSRIVSIEDKTRAAAASPSGKNDASMSSLPDFDI